MLNNKFNRNILVAGILVFHLVFCVDVLVAQPSKSWVEYAGVKGPGNGKKIVFISGDEEYRSEEALPMLAQILAKRFGFTCTVLFSTDPKTGEIDPNNEHNINGLEHLKTADLVVLFTRFRELPDSQMKYFDDYIKSGGPIVALRTATHAFRYQKESKSPFAKYDYTSKVKDWEDGFGRKILGETWVSHHGEHGKEGNRALINGVEQNNKNPILNSVHDIWGYADVYTVRKFNDNCNVLVYGQPTSGMSPESPLNVAKPLMPTAWTKTYSVTNGKTGRVFTTTMGAAVDLKNEDLRRLIVNACFWATGLEKQIPEKADVNFITDYNPTMFGFDSFQKGQFPSRYELK